jgi:proteasome lid subunit RPN8/RPN11
VSTEIPLLEIPWRVLDAMVAHCQQEAPLEACGILAGRREPQVDCLYPLRNELARCDRYNASPADLIAAIRAMRSSASEMLALYHSHPATPPIPSQTDLELNHYGTLPRIIVSLAQAVPEVRIWRLGADQFEEVRWRALRAGVESGRSAS